MDWAGRDEIMHVRLFKKLPNIMKRKCLYVHIYWLIRVASVLWSPQAPATMWSYSNTLPSVHNLSSNSTLPSSELCLHCTVSALLKNNYSSAPSIGNFVKCKIKNKCKQM